jgi:hypothetical protein
MVTGKETEEDPIKFIEFKQLVRARQWSRIRQMPDWSPFSVEFLRFIFQLFETTPSRQMTAIQALSHPAIAKTKKTSSPKQKIASSSPILEESKSKPVD